MDDVKQDSAWMPADVNQGWKPWPQQNSGHNQGYGTGLQGNDYAVLEMLKRMEIKQDKRYEEQMTWQSNFQEIQNEWYRTIHEHLATQDANFKFFGSHDNAHFSSIRNDIRDNNVAIQSRINGMMTQGVENREDNLQFYEDMCNLMGCVMVEDHFKGIIGSLIFEVSCIWNRWV
ncbi:unnamed protein product [Vicia faba]|uniref:Uncharacterized protein n=1 Tax=Vicia faba TaxID=3906 RepID=A0AAV0YX34_VICFA|nr:unnamed protein product [Vicia faba]